MLHTLAYHQSDTFAGWPANNALWHWPDGEILTGCVTGPFLSQPYHNLTEPHTQRLLRSMDGGLTWQVETPANYAGSGGEPQPLTTALDFSSPDFAMRVAGAGYHGTDEPRGAFYVSTDRGHHWSGPFAFTGLVDDPEVAGEAFSPRTDVVILGSREALLMLSVRGGKRWPSDRVFCASTADGGQTFAFRAWIPPLSDPHRSVMPNSVRLPGGSLISALRRRRTDAEVCWIDVYASLDEGRHWELLSKVADTGAWNGNPPALTRLPDGRLFCVFGDRTRRVMAARCSTDGGHTWPDETILRDDFYAEDDEPDFGYPRLTCLPDGTLLALYYWATRQHPQQHIAATRWQAHS